MRKETASKAVKRNVALQGKNMTKKQNVLSNKGLHVETGQQKQGAMKERLR